MALLVRAGNACFPPNNCYSKLILSCAGVKAVKKYSTKLLSYQKCSARVNCSRNRSTINSRSQNTYLKYDDLVEQRRAEARRSVLVEVQSEKSCGDVYQHCSKFGSINHLFHYTPIGSDRHFILIEFEDQISVDNVLEASTHTRCDNINPVRSTILWFRHVSNKSKHKVDVNYNGLPISLFCCAIMKENDLRILLRKGSSISNQIMLLYDNTKLNELGSRLRFFTAYQIEHSFVGLLPKMAVLPFGSSVNGFGKRDCDLDLGIQLEKDLKENPLSRLVFQCKSIQTQDKREGAKLLEVIADTMNFFLPGISNINKILGARVPIVKFHHSLTGVDCDLAITHTSGYYMSELLYIYGEIDWRLRPLTFTIRKWAERCKLTRKTPGPWITNFSLSCMVIFFLQQKGLLPSLDMLRLNATDEDHRIADSTVDCTFQRDISQFIRNKTSSDSESLEELLSGFLSYYGKFDFESKAISLRTAKPVPKLTHSALYICNPLETSLNVSRNVSFEQVENLRVAIRNAAWFMEDRSDDKSGPWGLLKLFADYNTVSPNLLSHPKSKKSINFDDLFDADDVDPPRVSKHSKRIRTK
ncbi:hypothetical protein QAD02_015366 [Eretmocerus hayati]|uniref:Uncharacterized protein n=1 Tax=Eretmocerus hayati TaxID=131215 RepID=A0ACC2PAI4_9HYME|nr:hypothetical protein QAD02_015366 [Eretmocerus hayati]